MEKKRDPEKFLLFRRSLDEALVAKGFIETPKCWWDIIERFERSLKERIVIRKGRRVGASTLIAPRQVVSEALWGEHRHDLGTQEHTYAFLSISKEEAANRLKGIEAILKALDVPYRKAGSQITLTNRPAIFKVVVANYRRAVGETVAFCWCDEVTRWIDKDTSANPANEVIKSIAPALLTLPNAKMWVVSSALGNDDYHAQLYDLGETDGQCVAFGSTWDLNPTLTEEKTKKIEPDHKTWLREYAAIPQGSDTAAFPIELIDFAFERGWPNQPFIAPGIIATDFSSGGSNDTVRCYAGWKPGLQFVYNMDTGRVLQKDTGVDRTDWFNPVEIDIGNDQLRRSVELKKEFDALKNHQLCFGPFKSWTKWHGTGITLEHICQEIVVHAKETGATYVVGDMHQDRGIEIFLSKGGARFEATPVNNTSKKKAAIRFRNLLASKQVAFMEKDKKLRSQLINYREVVKPSGITFTGKVGNQNDDYVGCIINAMIAEDENVFPGSPIKSGLGRKSRHQDEASG